MSGSLNGAQEASTQHQPCHFPVKGDFGCTSVQAMSVRGTRSRRNHGLGSPVHNLFVQVYRELVFRSWLRLRTSTINSSIVQSPIPSRRYGEFGLHFAYNLFSDELSPQAIT